jgi:hypothetical protein
MKASWFRRPTVSSNTPFLTGVLFIGFGCALMLSSFVAIMVAESTRQFHASLSSGNAPVLTGRSLLDSKSDAAATTRDANQKVPRYNFAGDTVSNEFKPDDQSYLESIALLAAVGVVVAIFSVLFGLFFCCGRKCCNCCGGTKASKGCCCPTKDEFGEVVPRTYTTCERVWIRIGMLLVVAIVIGMSIMGYVGSGDFHTALLGTFDKVVEILDKAVSDISGLGTDADTLVDTLISASTPGVDASTKPTSAINDLKKAVNDVKKNIKDYKSTTDDYDFYRVVALAAVFALCMFIGLFGALGAVFGCGWPACIMSVFGFFVLFLVWILFAVHFPISVILSDACISVDKYIADREKCENMNTNLQANGQPTVDCTLSQYTPNGRYLNSIVQCVGNDQATSLYEFQWKTIEIALYSGGNKTAFTATNPAPATVRWFYKNCAALPPGTASCNSTSFNAIGAYRSAYTNSSSLIKGDGNGNYVSLFDSSSKSTVDSCVSTSTRGIILDQAYNCNSTTISSRFTSMTSSILQLNNLAIKIADLTSCNYVLKIFRQLYTQVCVDMGQAFDLCTAAFGAIGIIYMFGIFFALLGIKRFPKPEAGEEGAGANGAPPPTKLRPLPMKNMAMA